MPPGNVSSQIRLPDGLGITCGLREQPLMAWEFLCGFQRKIYPCKLVPLLMRSWVDAIGIQPYLWNVVFFI